jgi:alpha-tubulin suppressor-like RCC1 family protein
LGTWSKVSTSTRLTSAIKTDGTLWAWGKGQDGALGQGNTTNYSSPKQVGALTSWAVTSTGNPTIAAIKTNGTLWTWGRNFYGELGQGTNGNGTYCSSPIQVGALTTWSKIAFNAGTCAAIKTDGTLWTWGRNTFGQLGLGDKTNLNSPVQVGLLTNWSNISKTSYPSSYSGSFIATKTDNTLWSWGYNSTGQLGLGDTVARSSPTQVGTLTTWTVGKLGSNFGLGIKTAGSLWTWGYEAQGQLGHGLGFGVYNNTTSPVQVGLLTDWPVSSDKVDTGQKFCHAIKTDGTLWNWGQNSDGQLGKNNTTNISSPVQLGSLTTWTSISASTGVLAIASH